MRKIQLFALFTFFTLASAFTWLAQPESKYTVSVKDSKVHWLGKKVTGQHEGDIFLKSGEVTYEKGKLKGGSFTIDMNSITCTDITDAGTNKKLVGHLKKDDFFGVDKFPTATLTITSVKALESGSMLADMAGDDSKGFEVTADLTIKGKKSPVTFKTFVTESGKTVKATGKLTFDRSKFDVRFGSTSFFEGLGDRAIYNDVELAIDVTASK
jgi:polyisoprenoid-binding protein YceI